MINSYRYFRYKNKIYSVKVMPSINMFGDITTENPVLLKEFLTEKEAQIHFNLMLEKMFNF